jgi:hypothetical protein
MNHRTSILCRHNLRAYFAAFITYVMLAGQVAPLALAAARTPSPARPAAPASAPPSLARSSKAAPRPAPFFAAPNITATKVDSWDDSATPDGKAEPGQVVTYTVTITNTGDADATGVTFTDSVDPNTTLIPTSVQTQPVAVADSYNVIGNVRIQPNAAAGLLANDRDPDTGNNTPLTASGPTTTAQNGQITINSNGSFSYNPPAGFTGTDTVTYTIRDAGPDTIPNNADDKTDTAVATFLVGNGTSTPGANVVWFVNPSAPAGGDGRLTNPFNCYTGTNVPAVSTCLSATAADDPGDIIFLFSGAHTGGNALLNTQRLIGAGATDTLANLGGLTVPTGSDALPSTGGASPTITTAVAATNAIPLAQNNLLRGFTVGNTTGAKISGSSFGTLTVGNSGAPDVTLNGSGQALNLTNGAFAATSGFNGVTSTSSTTQGIILTGITGTVSFGSTNVSGATTQGILIGTTTADINFGNTAVSATTDAISFQNNSSGTRTFGTLTATGGATGIAFVHGAGGGNVTVNGLATLASAAANTVDIQNQAASTTVNFAGGATLTKTAPANTGINLNTDNGNVTFGGTLTIGTAGSRFPTTAVTITGGTTGVFSLGTVSIFTNGFAGITATNADGTLNVTAGTVDVNAASALNISGPAGFTTLGITLGTINSTGGTNNVNLTNTGGSVTLSGGALSGASGSAFVVSGNNPTVSYAGTLTQNNAGRIVDVQGLTGGSVAFTGTVTGGASSLGIHIGDTTAVNGNVSFSTLNLGTAAARMTNQAVTITNGGSGATYTLGTFAVFTNNAKGIVATNFDGTLNCNSTSTVDSSNATAIDIDGPAGLTTLGMTLVSVNSAGGTADGISLQDTNGSFSVLGDGTNTAVGGNSTGGTISNKSGADNNNAQGVGVFLSNVTNITLRRVTVNGTNQNYGVKGFSVNNFTLEYSTVGGTNGTAASLTTPENYGEGAVYFGNATANGTTGTVTITNNNINGGRKRNFSLVNTTAGTTTLTAKGNTFGAIQSFADAGTSFAVEARVATSGLTINTTLGGTGAGEPNTLTSAPGDLVNFTGQDGTTMDVVMRNNTLSDNHAFNNSGGGGIAFATKGTMTFHVTGNTMRDANGSAVTFFKAASAISTPSMSGFFDSNTIGVAAVAGSGSKTANGIFVSAGGTGTMSYTITNNQIHQISGNAHIYADNTGGSYTANFDIRGNTLDTPVAPNWFGGILMSNGANLSSDTVNVCAKIGGSTLADKNTFNLGAGQIGVFIVSSGAAAGHTFNLPGYAGGANLTNVQNFIAGNNTMNGTTVSASNDPPATAAAFTGVGTGCGTPTSQPAPIPNGARSKPGVVQPAALEPQATATTSNNVTDRAFVSPRTASPTAVAPQRTTTLAGSTARATTTAAAQTTAAPTTRESSAPVIDGAGGNVSVNIGTLVPGDSVTITFQVTVDNPFVGALPQVSNQGTVNYGPGSLSTLTDDSDVVGANQPTVTPINAAKIKINDAKQAEPTSGTRDMVFTVALTSPATGNITVDFTTQDEPAGPGKAVAGACGSGGDYTATSGQVAFSTGQQVKTINVPICSDATPEPDETFLVTLSNPAGAVIQDGQATGTITAADTPGALIISEFRTRGTAGANDDFVELYNNTNASMNIAGYGVFKMGSGCAGTPVLLATIPNDANANVPAHGHYLLTGSAYSLANYGGTGAAAGNAPLSADIEDDVNLAVFSTAAADSIASTNRLDAVGFGTNTGGVCDLMREGSTLAPVGALNIDYSYFRKECDLVPGVPCAANGFPKDTNDNSADFMFADTAITPISGITPRLGAPGPQNRAAPIHRDDTGVVVVTLDTSVSTSLPPNRERPTTSGDPNTSPQGRLEIRRRVQNTTASTVTRLRFRIMEMTTGPTPPAGTADLRAITSSPVILSGVNDPATCASTGVPTTTPCTVTAVATTLETPPTQTVGGGYNSTLSVSIPGGLAPGASIDVNFALGVYQSGSFRFYIIVEALP